MNLMNGLNRIITRAKELQSLKGDRSSLVDKEFNINVHLMFFKTCMVLKATITKSGKDGINKKRLKVRHLDGLACAFLF